MTEPGAQETTKVARRPRAPIVEAPEAGALTEFDRLMRAAEYYSKADILPDTYKGKPANVLICMELAHRVGQHWLAIAQNLYMVKGKPAWMTSYLIGLVNVQHAFEAPITWTSTGDGDDLVVTAHTTLHGGLEIHEPVSMKEAKADGWVERNAKYKTLPKLMLTYRAASRLIRLYAPQVQHGMSTVEEIEDAPEEREVKVLDVKALEAPRSGQLNAPRADAAGNPLPSSEANPTGFRETMILAFAEEAEKRATEPQDAPEPSTLAYTPPKPADAGKPAPAAPAAPKNRVRPLADDTRTVAPGDLDAMLEKLDEVAAIRSVPASALLQGCVLRLFAVDDPLEVLAKDLPKLRAEVDKLVANVRTNTAKVAGC